MLYNSSRAFQSTHSVIGDIGNDLHTHAVSTVYAEHILKHLARAREQLTSIQFDSFTDSSCCTSVCFFAKRRASRLSKSSAVRSPLEQAATRNRVSLVLVVCRNSSARNLRRLSRTWCGRPQATVTSSTESRCTGRRPAVLSCTTTNSLPAARSRHARFPVSDSWRIDRILGRSVL